MLKVAVSGGALTPFNRRKDRSSFRDWAQERTTFPREVCERALAHVVRDKAEAAYARSDLFERRRELMDRWAAFVGSADAEVVTLPLRSGRL